MSGCEAAVSSTVLLDLTFRLAATPLAAEPGELSIALEDLESGEEGGRS